MLNNIHKFYLNGLFIVLDINSSSVHIVDRLTYDILTVFNGKNDLTVINMLNAEYAESEIREALEELHDLIAANKLFSEPVAVPEYFSQEPVVKSLCLHIAHDCNLRCGYCFAGTGDFGQRRGLMSKRVGERAVELIIENSGSRIHSEIDFFGGEPLLNMETVRHVTAYVRKREQETGKRFKLTLTTNGILLNSDIMDFLNSNDISLVLSLDGRRETHDRMRPYADGSGSYLKAAENFTKVVKARNNQNYYLRGTFTAYNLDFTADVAAMAELGFTELSVEPVVAKDADYAIAEQHLQKIFLEYERLAEFYLRSRTEGKRFDFFHFNMDLDKGPCLPKRLSGCGAGHEYFAVTPEGDIYPCHQFVGRTEFLLGDVFSGIKQSEWPRRFRETHVLNKAACSDCWARFFCSGGCHANAELFNGDISKPYQIGCELQKKRLECALMIQAKLAIEK